MGEKYITRGMRAKCEFGSAETGNFLNVVVDHGVIVGANQEPLMNANDHTSEHVTQFGNCSSPTNPKRAMQKNITNFILALGGGALSSADLLEDVGVATCKCTPDTPRIWQCGSVEHLLDGAPVLTMESVLHCRNGGIIEMLPIDEYPPDVPPTPAEEAPTEDTPPSALEMVNEAVSSAIENAIVAIANTGEAGVEAILKVQNALATAATMPPQAPLHSCELDNMVGGLPFSPDDITLERMFSIAGDQRAKNYAHNMAQAMPAEAVDKNGMIIKQHLLKNFAINNYGADSAGCGAISLYNAAKILDPESNITFPQVIYWMEPYGILNNTFGAFPAGVFHAFNEMGYDTQYCFIQNPSEISAAAAQADAAIVLYATTKNVHYVAFQPDSVSTSSDGQQPQTFTFYNESSEANDSKTYEDFHDSLSEGERTRLGSVTILLNKPK